MATKRTFEENLALVKTRGAIAKADPPTLVVAKQLSLELWPDAVRGVPNAVLRGALFGVSKIRKTHKKRTLIAAVDGYEIHFKGETFNQRDFDVFQSMLHLAMPHQLGTRVEFSVHALLKQLGRKTSGIEYEDFKNQMMRLIGGAVEIYSLADKKAFVGTLVQSAKRDDETGRYVVTFDQDMLKLYQTGYTLVDWDERQALSKNALAQWLQGFYSSHVQPFGYKVETLHHLCGSTADLKEFRRMLRIALERLEEVGAIKNWEIEDGLVKVQRVHTPTQIRHLTKKGKTKTRHVI